MIRNLISILTLICVFSCKSDPNSSAANGQNKATANKVFHYNQPIAIKSLDPVYSSAMNSMWACNHLFNSLVQLDESLNIKPSIAKSWTISEDGKSYTFQLRDDVYFHDNPCFENGKGRKVNASDVKYSFERIVDPAVNSPGSWIFKDRLRENPFEVVDESTFALHLQKPFLPMLGILSMQYCSVVPKEAVDKYKADFRRNPVGTGPFMFKNWLEDQALILIKHPNYFEQENGQQLPYLDGVRISFIPDRKTAYLEFSKGKLDFLSGLESSFVNELLETDGTLKANQANKFSFSKAPFLNMEYLGFNMNTLEGPLKDKRVRQALNYAINRPEMLKVLRNGVGQAADAGFIPKGLPSFSNSKVAGFSFDQNKARQLLKAAGFENGKGIPEIKLMTTNNYLDLCTYITRQWADIGVKSKIDIIESGTLRQMNVKGKVPFFRASWIADYPDGETFLTMFYSKYSAPPNYTRFSNAEFDKLYEAALAEVDNEKRYRMYHKMDQIIVEEAPVIFLFYDETANFSNKSISGLKTNAQNLLSLKRVKK